MEQSLWITFDPSPKGHGMMKTKDQLQSIIDKIASPDSLVGMDAVYVHALILDKLLEMDRRLSVLEEASTNDE